MNILKLFCHVDDFCQWLITWEHAKQLGVTRKRGSAPRLSLSEVMSVLIHFHQSHYRDFKAYYTQHVCKHKRIKFPFLVSYTRFVELIHQPCQQCVSICVCILARGQEWH